MWLSSAQRTPVQSRSSNQYESPNGMMTPPASQSPPSSQERPSAESHAPTRAQELSDSSSGQSSTAHGKRTRTDSFGTLQASHRPQANEALTQSPNPRHRKSVRHKPSTPRRAGVASSDPDIPRSALVNKENGETRSRTSSPSKKVVYAAPIPGLGLSPFKSVLSQPVVAENRVQITHSQRPRFSSAEPVAFTPTKIRARQLQFAILANNNESDSSSNDISNGSRAQGGTDASMARSSSQQSTSDDKGRKKSASSSSSTRSGPQSSGAATLLPAKGKLSRRSTFGRSHSWASFSTPPPARGMRVTKEVAQPVSPSDDPLLLYASHCAEWDYGTGSPSFSRSRVLRDVSVGDWTTRNEVGIMTERDRVECGISTLQEEEEGEEEKEEGEEKRGDQEKAGGGDGTPKFLRTQSMFEPIDFGPNDDDESHWQPGHADSDSDGESNHFDSSVAANVFQSTPARRITAPADDEPECDWQLGDSSSQEAQQDIPAEGQSSVAEASNSYGQSVSEPSQNASVLQSEIEDGSADFDPDANATSSAERSGSSSTESIHSGLAETPSHSFADHTQDDDGDEEYEVEQDTSLRSDSDSRSREDTVEESQDAASDGSGVIVGNHTEPEAEAGIDQQGHSLKSRHDDAVAAEEDNGRSEAEASSSMDPYLANKVSSEMNSGRSVETNDDAPVVKEVDGGEEEEEEEEEAYALSGDKEAEEPDYDQNEDDDDISVAEVEQSLFVSRLDDDDDVSEHGTSSDGQDERHDILVSRDGKDGDWMKGDVSMRSQDQDAAAEEEQEASQSDDSSMAGDDDVPTQPTETPRRNSVPAMLPMASPLTPYPALSTPFHSRGAPGSTPFNAATSPTRTTLRVVNESASPGTLQRANSSASLLLMKSSEHPVIQISSLDPRAAAKAAAILKLHYQYVEEGFSHEEVDVMELKKYGLSVRDIRGLSAHDVSELPNVLADEELKELERQQGRSIRARHRQSGLASPIFFRSKGKNKAKQDGDWTLSGSSDSDKPTPPLTPSTDLMSSSPARSGTGFSPNKGNSTPRLPGAWVWTPAKAQQSVTKGKAPESHRRSPVKGGNNSTPRLSPDPLVWELSEWSALDRVFRQRVREHAIRLLDASELGSDSDTCPLTASSSAQRLQIRSASDCNTTKKLKAHCLAALEVDVEKVFTTFVQKHHTQESQLNGVWSSHRFATRIAALQRRYLDRVDKHYRSKHVEQSQLELVAIAHAELNEMHEPLNEANRSAGREGVLRLNAAELSVDPSKIGMPAPSAQASPAIFPTEDSMDFSLIAKGKVTYARGGEGMLHSTPVIRRSAEAGTVGAGRTAAAKVTPSSSTLTAGRKDLRRAVLERTHGGNTDEPEPEPLFAAKGLGANKDDAAGPRSMQSNDLRRSSTPKPQSRLQSGGTENLTPAERLRSRLAASQ